MDFNTYNRKKFTDQQLHILEEFFKKITIYPDKQQLTSLCETVADDYQRVQYWFAAERKRSKRRNPDLVSGRQTRRSFSKEQRRILKQFFVETSRYPTASQIQYLSDKIGDSEARTRQWFLYTREQVKKKGYLVQEEGKGEEGKGGNNNGAYYDSQGQTSSFSGSFETSGKLNSLQIESDDDFMDESVKTPEKLEETKPEPTSELVSGSEKFPDLIPDSKIAQFLSSLANPTENNKTTENNTPNDKPTKTPDKKLPSLVINLNTSTIQNKTQTNSPSPTASLAKSASSKISLELSSPSKPEHILKTSVTLVFGESTDIKLLTKERVDYVRDEILNGESKVRSTSAFSGNNLTNVKNLNLGSIDPESVQNVIFDFSKFVFIKKFPFLKNAKTVDEISNVDKISNEISNEPKSGKQSGPGNYLTRIGSFYGVCGASTRLLHDWITDLRSRFKNVNNVIGIVDNDAEISYKMVVFFLSQDSSLDFTLLEQNKTDINNLDIKNPWFIEMVHNAAIRVQAQKLIKTMASELQVVKNCDDVGEDAHKSDNCVANFSSDEEQ